jgi:hypothetical protein
VPGRIVGLSDVDVVKAVFAAFAERDLERVLELAAPKSSSSQ